MSLSDNIEIPVKCPKCGHTTIYPTLRPLLGLLPTPHPVIVRCLKCSAPIETAKARTP